MDSHHRAARGEEEEEPSNLERSTSDSGSWQFAKANIHPPSVIASICTTVLDPIQVAIRRWLCSQWARCQFKVGTHSKTYRHSHTHTRYKVLSDITSVSETLTLLSRPGHDILPSILESSGPLNWNRITLWYPVIFFILSFFIYCTCTIVLVVHVLCICRSPVRTLDQQRALRLVSVADAAQWESKKSQHWVTTSGAGAAGWYLCLLLFMQVKFKITTGSKIKTIKCVKALNRGCNLELSGRDTKANANKASVQFPVGLSE